MRLRFVLALLAAVVPATPALAGGLRLLTYNLNYGNPRPETSLDAIAKADVDVVLLQEITPKPKSAP